jgi:serine phosphatase RsbU (regulator of sigma subunit)
VIFDSKGGVQNTLLAPLENPDISTLFNGDVGFQTKQSVDADSVSVLTVWSRLGSFDWALRVQKSLKAEALYTAFQIRKIVLWSLILFLLVMAATYFAAVGISGRISAVTMATARVAAGHFDLRINPGSADEVGLLSVSVNRMAYEIQQLMEARTEAVRREMELKTAEMVQGTFLPEAHCEEYGLLSRGVFRPATECAGDLWGRFNLGKGKVLLMIADAVGHGASAALIAAMAYSYFATLQKSAAERAQAGSLTPNLILQDLHAVLWGAGKGLTTMTMVVALVDVNKGVLQIANAGHPFPMFIANGKAPAVVNVGGSILGLTDVSEFGERQIELQPGDKLFMYTDGMVECVNTQGDVMKPRKVKKMLADAASNTQNAFFDTVSQELDTFFENATLTDDVTALMMEVAPHWKAQTA